MHSMYILFQKQRKVTLYVNEEFKLVWLYVIELSSDFSSREANLLQKLTVQNNIFPSTKNNLGGKVPYNMVSETAKLRNCKTYFKEC